MHARVHIKNKTTSFCVTNTQKGQSAQALAGSVVKSDLYTQLKKLDIQKLWENRNRHFADYPTRIREAHDRVILSFQVSPAGARTCEAKRKWIEG